MIYFPESQQLSEQQQPANQVLRCQTTITQPGQLICTTESVAPSLIPQLEPATLVEYGGIACAIILSLTAFVYVLAKYNKVFIPVMLQKQNKKK